MVSVQAAGFSENITAAPVHCSRQGHADKNKNKKKNLTHKYENSYFSTFSPLL